MASRKENMSALMSNSRSRVIVIISVFSLIVAATVGFFGFRSRFATTEDPTVISGRTAARIESIPGSVSPTEQYAKLVAKQNEEQAEQALKTVTKSAIPTIIRTEQFGKGKAPIKPKDAIEGVGFGALSRLQTSDVALKGLWYDNLKASKCSDEELKKARSESRPVDLLREAGCTPEQMLKAGYNLSALKKAGFSAKELRAAGFSASDLKAAGFNAKQLFNAGFSACEMKAAGFTAKELLAAGYTPGELKGAGFSDAAIRSAGGLPNDLTPAQIRSAGCSVDALKKLRLRGVSAKAIRDSAGCSAKALREAGYSAKDLAAAGFTAKELKQAGFSCRELKDAGFSAQDLFQAGACTPEELKAAGFSADAIDSAEKSILPGGYTVDSLKKGGCSVTALKRARAAGVSAADIRRIVGCDAKALRAAGYTAQELKNAGFTAKELKDAGFSAKELKDAGFSAKDLKDAGFSAEQLKAAGFDAKALKDAGFSASELKNAGFSAKDLKDAGFTAAQLSDAGLSAKELQDAGFDDNAIRAAGLVPPKKETTEAKAAKASDTQLEQLLKRQAVQISAQKLQQRIRQRESKMTAAANKVMSSWKPATQSFVVGTPKKDKNSARGATGQAGATPGMPGAEQSTGPAMIKAGDILFAVLDTAVNSDEPGPILATIVSGKFKGARLIGSLSKPANADAVIISFNLMSIRGRDKSTTVTAVAIDQETARTALASDVDHHYLSRYGTLFAASFLEGYGSALQSIGSSVTTNSGGVTEFTQANRSVGQNLWIATGQLGQAWGQSARKRVDRPPTITVNSGTALGILFTADVTQ